METDRTGRREKRQIPLLLTFPPRCVFFSFLSFFSPPRSLVSQPVGVGWWRAPEMGSVLAAPDRAVLMGADDD